MKCPLLWWRGHIFSVSWNRGQQPISTPPCRTLPLKRLAHCHALWLCAQFIGSHSLPLPLQKVCYFVVQLPVVVPCNSSRCVGPRRTRVAIIFLPIIIASIQFAEVRPSFYVGCRCFSRCEPLGKPASLPMMLQNMNRLAARPSVGSVSSVSVPYAFRSGVDVTRARSRLPVLARKLRPCDSRCSWVAKALDGQVGMTSYRILVLLPTLPAFHPAVPVDNVARSIYSDSYSVELIIMTGSSGSNVHILTQNMLVVVVIAGLLLYADCTDCAVNSCSVAIRGRAASKMVVLKAQDACVFKFDRELLFAHQINLPAFRETHVSDFSARLSCAHLCCHCFITLPFAKACNNAQVTLPSIYNHHAPDP